MALSENLDKPIFWRWVGKSPIKPNLNRSRSRAKSGRSTNATICGALVLRPDHGLDNFSIRTIRKYGYASNIRWMFNFFQMPSFQSFVQISVDAERMPQWALPPPFQLDSGGFANARTMSPGRAIALSLLSNNSSFGPPRITNSRAHLLARS